MTITLTVLCTILSIFLPAQHRHEPLSPEFKRKLLEEKWITYTPSCVDPRRPYSEDEMFNVRREIARDFKLLRDCGFTGLVTYGAGSCLTEVPRLAREAGFTSVIGGVWAPWDAAELKAAHAVKSLVDGYCIGNEGMMRGEYNLEPIVTAIADLKRATGLPVTTAEPMHLYEQNPGLVQAGDWIFPTVHPYWAKIRNADEAVAWTVKQFDRLRELGPERTVIFKEVGYPTDGDPTANEELQKRYYDALPKTHCKFMYFEAFDVTWKTHDPCEPYWGLFKADRSPKAYIAALHGLKVDPKSVEPAAARLVVLSPAADSKARCTLTGDGGRLAIRGSCAGLRPDDTELLVFVNPNVPGTGWYLQGAPNGIAGINPDGSWLGSAQIGDSQYPPTAASPAISLSVLAVSKADAVKIRDQKKPGEFFASLPAAVQSVIIKDVKLDMD